MRMVCRMKVRVDKVGVERCVVCENVLLKALFLGQAMIVSLRRRRWCDIGTCVQVHNTERWKELLGSRGSLRRERDRRPR